MSDCVPDPGEPAAEVAIRVSRPLPGYVVLHVDGEVDMLTSATLTAAVSKELEADPANLILDLDGVSFLASSGLAVLIRAADEAAERKIGLSLIARHRAVLRPLQVTRTADRFTIHPSLDAALAGAAGR